MAESIQMPFGTVEDSSGLTEPCGSCMSWGSRSPHGKGQFWAKRSPIVKYRDFCAVNCAKTAEHIDLPFGLWTGWAEGSTSSVEWVPMCLHVRAHWRHLANTIEPSVCGGDAALCQITLTTCYYYYNCLCVCVHVSMRH